MLQDSYVRKIGLVDETVYTNNKGQNIIKVYPLDKGEPEEVVLNKTNLRDYRALLSQYPSLMKHAKRGKNKLWTIKL